MNESHWFTVESGSQAGTTFPVGSQGGAIGREVGNFITLEDPYLAPFHARFDWHQGYLYVSDLGSGAGTRVNGQPIATATPLRPGDIVDVGASRLRFGAGSIPANQAWPASPSSATPQPAGGWAAPGGFAPGPVAQPGPPAGGRPAQARGPWFWWYVGGGAAALLLCCVASVAVFVAVVVRGTAGPRDVATNYYKALGAHDWERATTYLATTTSQSATQQRNGWTSLETKYGTFTKSSVTNTSIVNATATVKGTLKFSKGSVAFTLNMVKEGDAWKIE